MAKSQSKITAVSGNADQSEPDLHFDLQIHPCISCILNCSIYSKQKATQMLMWKYSTRPLEETYQVQMSAARAKWASKCPGRESGGRVK